MSRCHTHHIDKGQCYLYFSLVLYGYIFLLYPVFTCPWRHKCRNLPSSSRRESENIEAYEFVVVIV